MNLKTDANIDLKIACLQNNIRLYEIASELGISEFTFSRRLRKELDPEEKEKVLKIIERIKR